MKAAQITGYGDKEAVQTIETDKPTAGEGHVLVEVSAAGVNPFDIKVREGMVKLPENVGFPATLGGDFAGTVVETGQRVYGQAGAMSGQGSFAQFVPVKTAQLAPAPESVDDVTAAALPLVSVSAYQAIIEHMDLRAGQKILIHGGGGGIGNVAIQIAKNLGAYVATTARAEEADFVKGLGADEVIDYQTQDFSEILKDYDAVFDTIGGETTIRSYSILKPGGSLVSMVEQPDEGLIEKHGVKFTSQFTRVTTEKLNYIAGLVDSGKLHVIVDKIFPLEEAAEALEYLKTGHPRGKVVIRVKA